MELSQFPILTFVTFFPMVGVLILLIINRKHEGSLRAVTFLVALINFIASLYLYKGFELGTPQMQFMEKIPWIEEFGISYFMGIDGISLYLILLTTFLTVISVLACWKDITHRVKEFMICILFLETGMLGVFCALDLFLFYVFWEVMLIPMYLIIGIWGSPARRIYAAIKFVLFTIVGSLLMLVAILALYFINHAETGEYTFNLLRLYNLAIPFKTQMWLFLGFFLAFAIKVPMFPLHTWLPDAHTEAPTVGSVLLAAVLLKMGTYGFIRYAIPLFPNAAMASVGWISALAIIGIIYGAWVAMVQKDMKRLVAFSSVSHLGFVILGMFALTTIGVEGSILQMINHGLSTGALFLVVGMIYERRHTRMISEFGGISKVMPIYAIFFMIFTLSSIGLPGLNGFVGEFLILLGTFAVNKPRAILAATGVIFAAVYMLWMYQRVMFGEVTNPKNQRLLDLSLREVAVLVPIVLACLWIGLYPKPFLVRMEPSVNHLLVQVERKSNFIRAMEKMDKSERIMALRKLNNLFSDKPSLQYSDTPILYPWPGLYWQEANWEEPPKIGNAPH